MQLLQSQQSSSTHPAHHVNIHLLYVDAAAHRLHDPIPSTSKPPSFKTITMLRPPTTHASPVYYWPRMNEDIAVYVRSCGECYFIKLESAPSLLKQPF